MTVTCNLTVKFPKWRLRLLRLVIFVIAPLVRSEQRGEVIANAMANFVGRGLRVYADGERV